MDDSRRGRSFLGLTGDSFIELIVGGQRAWLKSSGGKTSTSEAAGEMGIAPPAAASPRSRNGGEKARGRNWTTDPLLLSDFISFFYLFP